MKNSSTRLRRHARWLGAVLPLLLAGCLEVEQHPPWRDGQYNGKPDDPPQRVYYHNDRLSWNAAITNRNHLQNEYERTQP
ncbi:hypothetical protein [Noviherbaspirillum aerium]|uniref:hypothetical protein n=1 Tax=Noviherbaspirillum aerium TaxID=2588497 RepID=UPI00124D8D46|nr:hypothetical protein [Noviherbaspirillum aerium]